MCPDGVFAALEVFMPYPVFVNTAPCSRITTVWFCRWSLFCCFAFFLSGSVPSGAPRRIVAVAPNIVEIRADFGHLAMSSLFWRTIKKRKTSRTFTFSTRRETKAIYGLLGVGFTPEGSYWHWFGSRTRFSLSFGLCLGSLPILMALHPLPGKRPALLPRET